MQQSHRQYTVEDYLSLQRGVELKLEYFDGEIYAMAGGSVNHNRISRNVLTTLASQLEGTGCEAFGSDMRIVTPSGLYTYPDASAVCGETRRGTDEMIVNPVVLVEVLSDSTREYDRARKFDLYRSIPTLRHYVLIEQASVEVEHRCREEEGGWVAEHFDDLGQTVRLVGADLTLSLEQIYAGVELA